jgi:heme/copper-type cytochrome/quinol oxidase subunit 2
MRSAPDHLDVAAAETFGRDAVMFQDLLSFMTTVSLVLWAVVLLTAIVRFVACHVLYRRREHPTSEQPQPRTGGG